MNTHFAHELAPHSFRRHLIGREKKAKARKRLMVIGLTLTSMVDMFSLLVIFLLQTFSTSPEMLAITKGVTLPTANTGAEMRDAPILALTHDEIYLDQKLIGTIVDLLREPTPLLTKLEELREGWLRSHPGAAFPGEISLQADRTVASTVISQVMGFLPSQSYGVVQMVVLGGGA